MNKKTFHIVSLGCAKNTVDSDSMAQLLTKSGYKSVSSPNQADVLIVNTCGFINIAKEESRRVLAELAAKKKSGQVLIAAGCLTQRYGKDVTPDVPGIDGIIGTRRWMDIVGCCRELTRWQLTRTALSLAGGKYPRQRRALRVTCFRAGRQRLSKNRGRLPPPLCFLRHSID